MRVAVVNSSAIGAKGQTIYNLGAERIARYYWERGHTIVSRDSWNPMLVTESDKVMFSVIFTWDIPEMIRQVNLVRQWGKEVEIGGPAATFMAKYIEAKTGVQVHRGLDDRFENFQLSDYLGEYQVTFTSRGCPNNCKFCGVKKVEPVPLLYPDFALAPVIADNNILATPWKHQKRVVDRLLSTLWNIDFNSGFDVRLFQDKHFQLYSQLRLKCWRFAFDSMSVEKDVRRVANFMRSRGLDRHKVTFYVLVGFPGQTLEEVLYRLNLIIELGHNPYPMRFWPLNSLDRKYMAPGWTEELLYNLTQYYQAPYNWRSEGYKSFESFYPGKPKSSGVPANQSNFLS